MGFKIIMSAIIILLDMSVFLLPCIAIVHMWATNAAAAASNQCIAFSGCTHSGLPKIATSLLYTCSQCCGLPHITVYHHVGSQCHCCSCYINACLPHIAVVHLWGFHYRMLQILPTYCQVHHQLNNSLNDASLSPQSWYMLPNFGKPSFWAQL